MHVVVLAEHKRAVARTFFASFAPSTREVPAAAATSLKRAACSSSDESESDAGGLADFFFFAMALCFGIHLELDVCAAIATLDSWPLFPPGKIVEPPWADFNEL